MYYGNGKKVFFETTCIGFGVSTFFFIICVLFALFDKMEVNLFLNRILNIYWLFALLLFIIPLGLAPTFIQGIILKDGYIKNVLFRRWIINKKKISDLIEVRIQTNVFSSVIFIFEDKSKLRFYGAQVPEIQRLIDDLAKQTKHKVKVKKGNI
jgi:hypothetical protein